MATLDEHVIVDALQGGAGTSTNMNVNEVLANRAVQIAGFAPGDHALLSPEHVNLHQSTNDTYPTALKVAALEGLKVLETAATRLTESCQQKEREFADVVKLARTQLQDAVPITLGRAFGAFADAFARDRWRVAKCAERLRVVNLGGTAVGTGLGAPRAYIFRVVDHLRQITGLGLARAENLLDATQNLDAVVEASGIVRALAASLIKVSNDLRLLASGPDAGLGEIRLPPVQVGSSIMPGKINPVIPEAVIQAGWAASGCDQTLFLACAGKPRAEPLAAAGGRQPAHLARSPGPGLPASGRSLHRRDRGRPRSLSGTRRGSHGNRHGAGETVGVPRRPGSRLDGSA